MTWHRLTALFGLALLPLPAVAVPQVATDIAPVQSIAARVMLGIGEPGLILPPGASPHGYALRPSEARLLEGADVVIWIGPGLTPWLADPIAALAAQARLVTLETSPGVATLPIRQDATFEPDADDHEHDHAAAHDAHLWLDPQNAVAAARAIAEVLAVADPTNADGYAANAEAFADEMDNLAEEVEVRLAPLRGKPFLVFHDAYQYFEFRFDLPAAGSISLQEGVPPGTRRIADLRARVKAQDIVCAFAEPQFEPALLATVIEGSDVRTGTLDPLGTDLPIGPTLYPALIANLVDDLAACLGD